MTTSPFSVTFLLVSSICVLIGFLQIYGLYRFVSLRKSPCVQKRFPNIVILESVSCVIYLIFGAPLFCNMTFNDIEQFNISDTSRLSMILVPRILNRFLLYFIADMEACRLYLVSFALHYLNASKNSKWKVQIDRSFAEKDWYLLNKNRFGNTRYVFTRAMIYYFSTAIISVSLYAYAQLVNTDYLSLCPMVDGILLLLPLVIINYCYCKCPKVNDAMFFHFEFRTTALVMCTGFTINVIAAVTGAIGFTLMGYIYALVAAVCSLSVPSMLSTILIPAKITYSSIWVWICSEYLLLNPIEANHLERVQCVVTGTTQQDQRPDDDDDRY